MKTINLDQLFIAYKSLYGLGVAKIIPWLEAFWVGHSEVKGPGTTAKSIHDIVRLARGLPAENNITPKARATVENAVNQLRPQLAAANLTWHPNLISPVQSRNFNNAQPQVIPSQLQLSIEAINQYSLISVIYTRQIHAAAGIKEITQKYLQMLSVYAILKASGHPLGQTLNSVAFVIPLHAQIYIYELQNWNYQAWLEEVMYLVNKQMNTSSIQGLYAWTVQPPSIGRDLGTPHGSEHEMRIITAMQQLGPGSAFQIMLPVDNTGLHISPGFQVMFAQLIQDRNLQMYVHSPIRMGELLGYYGNRQVGGAGMSPQQAKTNLQQLVYYTNQLGGKGVVIHVPKGGGQQIVAFAKNVAGVAERLLGRRPREQQYVVSNHNAKIYVETPAGQGTETLTDKSDFVKLFSNEYWTDPDVQDMIAVCVDTCHVFALGYDPLQYIKDIQQQLAHKQLLIHFNDARGDERFNAVRGGRLDRHAWPGMGYVGGQRCTALREHIQTHNLPAVVEVGIDFQRGQQLDVEHE